MLIVIGLATLACFLMGMPGTIPAYRDAGDMISAAWTLGIAHPPGYPTYVVLAKLTTGLAPFANVAYRVNLFSALCGAGAAALLYGVISRHSGEGRNPEQSMDWAPIFIGVTTVFLWVASPAALALCRVAEMYALAALIAVAVVGLSTREDDRSRWMAVFLLGLGMGAQPVLIFLTPLVVLSFRRRPESRTMNGLGPVLRRGDGFLSFLAGASILLFLPIRAAQHPAVNWGDPSSWERFWRVITRADYGGLKLHPEQSVLSWTPGDVFTQLARFIQSFAGELGWGALVVGIWGAWTFSKDPSSRRWVAGLLVSWGLFGPGFFVLSNLPWSERTTPAILQPYLLLAMLLWIPLVAKGISSVIPADRKPGSTGSRFWTPAFAGVTMIVLFYGHPMKLSFSARYDFLAYDYGRNLMRVLPPNAVLYDPDDPTAFTLKALQLTENRRRDVIPLNFFRTRWGYEQIKRTWPDLLPPVPLDNAQALQHALWTYSVTKRPFYAELPQKFGNVPYRSEGLVYRADPSPLPAGRQAPPLPEGEGGRRPGEGLARAEAALSLIVRRGPFQVGAYPDFFSRQVLGYYAAAHSNLGLAYAEAGRTKEALHHYLEALRIDPGLVAALNNRGILAYRQNNFAEAIRHYETALRLAPHNEGLQANLKLARQRLQN